MWTAKLNGDHHFRAEQASTSHQPIVGSILAHLLRRLFNFDPAIGQCLVFAGGSCWFENNPWILITAWFLGPSCNLLGVVSATLTSGRYNCLILRWGDTNWYFSVRSGGVLENPYAVLPNGRRRGNSLPSDTSDNSPPYPLWVITHCVLTNPQT